MASMEPRMVVRRIFEYIGEPGYAIDLTHVLCRLSAYIYKAI